MGLAPCRDGVSPTFVGSRAGALPPPQHKVLPHTHRSSLLPHRSTCKTQQNQRTPDGNRRCESKASEGSEMLSERPDLAAALRPPRCPPLSISHPPMVPPHHAHTVGSARSWEGRAEGSVDPRSCARCSGGSPSRAVRSQLEAFWNEAGGSPCPAAPRSGPRRPSDPLLAGTSPVVAITKWKETLWILPCFRSDWFGPTSAAPCRAVLPRCAAQLGPQGPVLGQLHPRAVRSKACTAPGLEHLQQRWAGGGS